jgi:hypothetical protein
LRQFDADAESVCRKFKPQLLLVTGISPPGAGALQKIGKLGVCRCNFLTDDPWNSKNGAGFFLKSLRHYDLVYSPRRSNLADLLQVGCQQVEYLPFGYNQELHFPELPQTPMERERFACDVAFVGCADYDRIPMALALVQAGLRVNLYGAYWDRYAKLRSHWKGLVFGRELRLAVGGATVNICLGRKANRDGHAMRSLELPAMGACLLVEDTLEHRELFGDAGDCVEYYLGLDELVVKSKALCAQPERARALGGKVFQHICQKNRHTYADRLQTILDGVSICK